MDLKNKLFIYNSWTKKKELFKPINNNRVGIYVCGPTVYSNAHIGHARSSIIFDVIIRYLKYTGYKVKFIRNYTDVGHLMNDSDEGDDKIQKQASKEKIEPMEIVQKYINSYRYDMNLLNILKPNIEPQATSYIYEQIDLIQNIIEKGYAYATNGSVYFDVKKYNDEYKNYGNLSGKKIDELQSENRILNNQHEKKNNVDFALWKNADKKHIMKWKSPWGVGFPGWHTECVVLSNKYLGNLFDIHGGGIDLKFPHHECEIAQANIAYETILANYWMHNNLVTINGQKMSKSIGNFITIEDLFFNKDNFFHAVYSPMVLRFLILQSHYRNTLSLTKDGLEAAKKGYLKLANSLKDIKKINHENENKDVSEIDKIIENRINSIFDEFNDDINTAKVLANLFDLCKIVNDISNNKISINEINHNTFGNLKKIFVDTCEKILGLMEPDIDLNMINTIINIYKLEKNDKRYDIIDFIRSDISKSCIKIMDCKNEINWNYE